MELNINSPSYFTKQYGVIDEIYSMCRGISKHVENKQYSDLVDIVGITPIIAPKDIIEQGLFKQEKKCDIKYGFASVSLWIDYDEYLKADITEDLSACNIEIYPHKTVYNLFLLFEISFLWMLIYFLLS